MNISSSSGNDETDTGNDRVQAQKIAFQKIEDIIVGAERTRCSVGYEEVEAFWLELLGYHKTALGGYGIKIVSWLDITHIVEGKIEKSYEDKIGWMVTLDRQFSIVGVENVPLED